jgi:hypothetical protein
MWRGMKRAKRERFRRIMDQVYHVSYPYFHSLVLGFELGALGMGPGAM